MKTPSFAFPVVLLGVVLLTACADSGDATEKTTDQLQENREEMSTAKTDNAEEWRKERDEAVTELRDLRGKLETRRTREQERVNEGIKDAGKKAESEAMILELGTNIARIDASLMKMEASTGTDWSNVKGEARTTADDTKTWWDRQKDMVDQKTDADKDQDGH